MFREYWNFPTPETYLGAPILCLEYALLTQKSRVEKLLYHLSYSHFNDPVDIGHSRLCKQGSKGEIDFSCVVPYPGYVYTASVENDIDYHPDKPRKDRTKKKGTPGARNLVFGMRANVKNMIEGKEAEGRGGEEEEIRREMGEMGMWFDEGNTDWGGKKV